MTSTQFRLASILLAGFLPLGAAAEERVTHLIDLVLFEVVEEGVAPSDRDHVALNIFVVKEGRKSWATCQWTLIAANKEQKSHQLYLFSASTGDQSIRNLSVNQDGFAFDIVLWADRPFRVVAAGKAGTSNYKISAVGLWPNVLDKSKLSKREWKQVPSIALPYNRIVR